MDSLRDPERDGVLRSALRAAGLKGILAWHPEDIVMLSGSHPCFGMDLCLYPAVGRPILYAPQGGAGRCTAPRIHAEKIQPAAGERNGALGGAGTDAPSGPARSGNRTGQLGDRV